MRPKGVDDGHQVNIPEPRRMGHTEGGRRKASRPAEGHWSKVVGRLSRQIQRVVNPRTERQPVARRVKRPNYAAKKNPAVTV